LTKNFYFLFRVKTRLWSKKEAYYEIHSSRESESQTKSKNDVCQERILGSSTNICRRHFVYSDNWPTDM